MIDLTIDGAPVRVDEGSSLKQAIAAAGKQTPTLCWHPLFPTGANCRACVVELSGSRVLVPSCSRKAEPGMAVQTDSLRVRRARRLVLELLLGAHNLAAAPELNAYAEYYGAEAQRFAAPRLEHAAPPQNAAPRLEHAGGPLQDNPFFQRDYDRCILCRRCTEACGVGVQFTFAIAVTGRGAEAGIGTGGSGKLPDSPCVFCGNCVGACPTGALLPLSALDASPPALRWSPQEGAVHR